MAALGETEDDFDRRSRELREAPQPVDDGEMVLPEMDFTPDAGEPAAPAPDNAVDLLAQVKGGNVTRPAVEKAFPEVSKAPSVKPAAPTDSVDWKGLGDRLSLARGQQKSMRLQDDMYNGVNSVLNPHARSNTAGMADADVAGAEDELSIAKQKHAMGLADSAESDRKAEMQRRGDSDKLRADMLRAKWASDGQKAADAAAAKKIADQNALAKENERASADFETRQLTNKKTALEIAALEKKGAAKPKTAASMPKPGALDDVPEDMRETVRAIGEKRAKAPDPGSRFGSKILAMVNAVYPGFDSTDYGTYKDVKEKLSKSDEVVALNTAYSHIKRARANVPDNFDAQAANRVRQAWLTGTGADTLTPFETDVKIAADELAKAYGNNSEAGRATVERLLAPNQSRKQLESRLDEIDELLAGKLGSYQHQFERVAPKGASEFKVVSPENEAKPRSASGPSEGDEKTLSSGTVAVYRNGKWVKK